MYNRSQYVTALSLGCDPPSIPSLLSAVLKKNPPPSFHLVTISGNRQILLPISVCFQTNFFFAFFYCFNFFSIIFISLPFLSFSCLPPSSFTHLPSFFTHIPMYFYRLATAHIIQIISHLPTLLRQDGLQPIIHYCLNDSFYHLLWILKKMMIIIILIKQRRVQFLIILFTPTRQVYYTKFFYYFL